MLRVIRRLKENAPIPVMASFLAAHAYPLGYKQNKEGYVNLIINEMLPRVAGEGLADFMDAFCEEGFFGVPRQLASGNFGFHGQAQFNHAAYLRKQCCGFSPIVTSGAVPMTQKNVFPSVCPGQEPVRCPPDRSTIDWPVWICAVSCQERCGTKIFGAHTFPGLQYASSCDSVPEVWERIRIRRPGNPSLPEPWIAHFPSVSGLFAR